MHPEVHSSTFHNSQEIMQTTQMPINGWTDKQNVACTYNGILFSLKKRRNFWHVTTQMTFKDIMLSKIGQSQKKPQTKTV